MGGADFEGRRGYGAAFEKKTEHLQRRHHIQLQVGSSITFEQPEGSGIIIAAVVITRVDGDTVTLQTRTAGDEPAGAQGRC